MQYIEFARKQKSSKKLSELITSVLRLHPTKPELWIYAANYVMEERNDIIEARAYMQRGLRFCKESKNLWIEYAKLEMTYVARIATRGQILGLNKNRSIEEVVSNVDRDYDNPFTQSELVSSGQDLDFQKLEFIDRSILDKLEALPVVSGAIPIAIFDAAMKQFGGDESVGENFFDMIAEFREVPHTVKFLQHITSSLLNTGPLSPAALSCFIRQPLVGVEALSPRFPGALGMVMDRLHSTMQDSATFIGAKEDPSSRSLLSSKIMKWMLSFISDDLDPDITKVIAVTLKKLWNRYLLDIQRAAENSSGSFADIFTRFQEKGFADLVDSSKTLALHLWPHDPKIQSLQNEVKMAC